MKSSSPNTKIAHPFDNVNTLLGAALSSNRSPEQPTALTSPQQVNTQLPLMPKTMIHHNRRLPRDLRRDIVYKRPGDKYYGVSSSQRVLTRELFIKKFDQVRDCLRFVLGLTVVQREVTLRLLRYWAYYGKVYPKESTITEDPGCSKSTFWRTISRLESQGLIEVINRFLVRPHAQTSNLYRLDKLVLLIAKYLAEHLPRIWPEWVMPYILMPWPELWSFVSSGRVTPHCSILA